MIEEEEGSKANVNYLNESPGAIRLGRTSDDERDCCGLREDEILGFEDDTFVAGNKDHGDEHELQQVEGDTEIDEVDLREARLVMQVELLSHLLRTVSIEVLQISPKAEKILSMDDSLYEIDNLFHDKAEEKITFDIYSDPDHCDDRTALDTVVDCNSNPASTIAAAEILLRRLLQVITDLRASATRKNMPAPGHSLTSESFGFDSVYSPLVKAAPRRKSKTEEGKEVKHTVPEVYPEQQHLITDGSPITLSPEDNSGTRRSVGNLANDYLRNEYITLDGSSGAEWIQVEDETCPPSFGIRSPEIDHLLETWTTDATKKRFLLQWVDSLSAAPIPGLPLGIQITNISRVVKDGFLMLLIPIMKTISMHALCVLVRQHDQNLDDEPIVFNFNGPDDDVLGDAGDSKDYLDSGNSDPFTGMESSVFDLRIKRDTTSSPKVVKSLSNAANGDGGLSSTNDKGETHKDYDFAYDFDAPYNNGVQMKQRSDSKEDGSNLVEDIASNGHTLLVNIISNIPILMKNTYLAKLTAPWFTFPQPDSADDDPAISAPTGGINGGLKQQQIPSESQGPDATTHQSKPIKENTTATINKIAAKLDELRRR